MSAHIEDLPPGDPASEVLESRIWVDGCWDFFHHGSSSPSMLLKHETLIVVQGHAGAMLQARQLGKELFVGIHSDESILENKGPTVMTLEER
jgi:ethanolamine-phosphate cytidylyltransferase